MVAPGQARVRLVPARHEQDVDAERFADLEIVVRVADQDQLAGVRAEPGDQLAAAVDLGAGVVVGQTVNVVEERGDAMMGQQFLQISLRRGGKDGTGNAFPPEFDQEIGF